LRLCGLGFALGLALGAPAHTAPLANPTALSLPANEAPPVIDGRLDDPAWQRAPVYEHFVQFLPVDKQAARWRTTVQV
ncbi:hypothetical protein ABTK06_20175, partial [Acinetobacter baumannii]